MNTKLHAVADAEGRPLSFFVTAGPVSDYTGAAALLDDLPKAQWLLGDRGYVPGIAGAFRVGVRTQKAPAGFDRARAWMGCEGRGM